MNYINAKSNTYPFVEVVIYSEIVRRSICAVNQSRFSGAVGTSDISALTACMGTLQTVLATTASGCAAISYAVASGDTEQLVWCWRKVRHNRDDVLVLCHPPPILHIADNQPLLYPQVYSHIVVSRCCR